MSLCYVHLLFLEVFSSPQFGAATSVDPGEENMGYKTRVRLALFFWLWAPCVGAALGAIAGALTQTCLLAAAIVGCVAIAGMIGLGIVVGNTPLQSQ